MMPVYWTDDFKGEYPVGTSAVIHAPNEDAAREQMDAELARRGLLKKQTKPYTLNRLKPGETIILNDGDY